MSGRSLALAAFAALWVVLVPAAGLAATKTSTGTGNWNTAGTWSPAGVPAANDDVIIATGHTVTLNANSNAIRSLTIQTGATLQATNRRLDIGNSLSPAPLEVQGTGALNFTGTASIRLTAAVQFNGPSTSTWAVPSIDLNSRALTFHAAADFTLNLTGGTPWSSFGSVNTSASNSNINFRYSRGGAQTVASANIVYGSLTVAGSGNKTPNAGTVQVLKNFVIEAGTWRGNSNDPAVNIGGNFTNSDTFTSGDGVYTFNGAAPQTLTGTSSFTNLAVNNSGAGLSLSSTITVGTSTAGGLTLTDGNISTGGNALFVARNCNAAAAVDRSSGTAGWVVGNLRKRFPNGANVSCSFEIGDALNYTPISPVTFTAVTNAGELEARTDSTDHPDTTGGLSGIEASRSVNRYWTLTLPAGSSLNFTGNSYSATFHFITGTPVDLDSGVNTAQFIVAKKAAGVWILPAVGTRTASSTQTTGITPANGFGEFAIGHAKGPVNHYQITHSSAGSTCQGEQVTISMHDASHGLVAGATTITITARRVAGTPAADKGDWSVVSGTPANFSNGGGDDGVATYTFAAGETSVVLLLTNTWPQTVNIDVVDQNGITEASGAGGAHSDDNLVFSETAFVFGSIDTQVAGTTSTTYTLTAVLKGKGANACNNSFNGTVNNIELAFECVDPTSCQPGQLVTFNNNGTGTIAANPAGSVTSYTSRNLTFTASGASFTFDYPDVGSIRLHARYTIPLGSGGLSGTVMTGSSNAFVVKPAGFAISNIRRTSDSFANPGATDANGTVFAKAGEPITLTVRSLNSLGNATPNYGKEVSPEGVLLTPALVGGLGLSATGTISNPTIAGTEFGAAGAVNDPNGDATVTNVSWSEVGIMRLTPSVGDGSYLGVGDVTGTMTGNIGRFYPDHFAVSAAGTLVPACSTATPFTYLGQPLAVTGVSLNARNAVGGTTQNYHGAFAKHAPAIAASWGFAARDGAAASDLTSRISSATVTGAWANGALAANVSALTLGRNAGATPEPPYTSVSLGIAPTDADGVAMRTTDFDLDVDAAGGNDHRTIGGASAVYRFGRLRLENAAGQGHLPLPLRVSVQYWSSGSVFVTNSDDGCTTLPAKSFVLSGHSGGITTANLPAPTGGSDGAVSVTGGSVSGVASVRLLAPSPSATTPGAVNLCIDLDGTCGAPVPAAMPWLRGLWSNGTAYTDNPRARATYGLYGSQPRNFIFHRENY